MADFRHRISTAKCAKRKKRTIRLSTHEIFDPHVCPQMMSAHRVRIKSSLEDDLKNYRIHKRLSSHLPYRCPLLLRYLVTQPIPWRSHVSTVLPAISAGVDEGLKGKEKEDARVASSLRFPPRRTPAYSAPQPNDGRRSLQVAHETDAQVREERNLSEERQTR
ncbi:hypothetical protein ALC60_04568 [Trachymyrmex zeteki]|uniref:Uncharacterized protein n=1 Tax=Mycetomoellerius zeteki TaxID=64791 RepID=A0A151X7Y6_9HYME|nr:hypothetical protein ALC60_04568 [Trachymyrmex zeteki]